jgi:hypothetical protein
MIGTIKTRCLGKLVGLGVITGYLLFGLPQTTSAQTCLQQEYNLVNKQKLNCSANDVKVAGVSGVTDLSGNPLSTCTEGSTFSFIANFNVVTTANAANAGGRDNIGLYFQTDPAQPDALTGSCVDNIIFSAHPCSSDPSTGTCGVTTPGGYQEFDPTPDNCGDTSSSVNPNITDRILVPNFKCSTANTAPCPNDPTKQCLTMPNCTSWQTPGSSTQCVATAPLYPYPFNSSGQPEAIPGAPSKCNCQVLTLPISPVTPSVIVQKACTTAQTSGPATFTQNPNTQSPTSCNVGNGTTTESGVATYTVAITNTTGTSGITIDQICDTAYGTVYRSASFTGPACAAGTNGTIASFGSCSTFDIPASGTTTATCTFSAGPQPETTTVTDTASVTGHADLNTSKLFGPTSSNSVSVTSTEVPSTAKVVKGFNSTLAACATVRYNVEVDNTSGADETEMLSALNDSSFGSITSVHDSVLATTCSANQTISVGGNYKCTFDAQFCSAVDASTCISHTNTITATVVGDEAGNASFNPASNTLTVKECLTPTITSQ